MATAKLVSGFASLVLVLMVPDVGRAQTCTSDADCGKGLRCLSDAVSPTPATAPCYAVDGGTCTPLTVPPPVTTRCQAAPCTSDGDCGTDMVCHQQTSTACTGGATAAVKCDPNTRCDAGAVVVPEPVICTDTSTSTCVYKWELPCNADADCGSAFTCQPTTYGMCSGSAGASSGGGTSTGAGGGAGTEMPTPPPVIDVDAGSPISCTTVSSYPGSCLAQTITCAASRDCPAGWTCTVVGGTTTVVGATMGVDAGIAPPPPVTTTVSACQPPSTHASYPTRGGTDSSKAGDAGTIALVVDGGATGSSTPPTPTVPGTSNGPVTADKTAAHTAGGGCSLGGSPDGTFALLGLLGLLGLAILRRR